MSFTFVRFLLVTFLAVASVSAQELERSAIPAAPTPPPPLKSMEKGKAPPPAALEDGQYLIGDPTDEEQLFLELINRARKDPVAEARRLLELDNDDVKVAIEQYGVDTNLMVQQFGIYPARPPLSFNAKLIEAARGHSQYQLEIGQQTHDHFVTANGVTTNISLGYRFKAVGYSYSGGGENVYAYTEGIVQGHAGFEIDWGNETGKTFAGMQRPPGHRNTMHDWHQEYENGVLVSESANPQVEVGIGVIHGNNHVPPYKPVGPMIVTQDYARPLTPATFLTGVAYYDLNGDNFYDLGEGLAGVRVTVDGETAFAVTTASGGWSIPVTPNQNHTVRFNTTNAVEFEASAPLNGADNFKVDYKPTFFESIATNVPSPILVGAPNEIRFRGLGGVSGYRARSFIVKSPSVETADTLTNVTLTVTSGYNGLSTTPSKMFHLGHISIPNGTNFTAVPQYAQFKTPYNVKPGARIDFRSRLGYAHLGETAKIEVSTDEGVTWNTVYAQRGITNAAVSDSSMVNRSVSLAPYVGRVALIRLNYDVATAGGWYNVLQRNGVPHEEVGWFIDDITFANMDQAIAPAVANLTEPRFDFNPTTQGNYVLQFQAVNGARQFPWGPVQSISTLQDGVAPTVALLTPINNSRLTDGNIVLTGTASDVGGVLRVLVSLNGGAFQQATGSSSWSLPLTLAPGANAVTVRAFDVAGNPSTDLSATFTYVLAAPIAVNVVGPGTVTPGVNGSNLEIGKAITLTATPTSGFSFVGWTGGETSDAAAVTFTMRVGLSLTATFADRIAPLARISAPTNAPRVGSSNFVAQGTASDGGSGLKVVRVRVENSTGTNDFTTATGTANWTAAVTLGAGVNTIRAHAVDNADNASAEATANVFYEAQAPVALEVIGKGTLVPNLTLSNLVVGKTYSVTATPATGFAFGGWTTNGVTNMARLLKFTMQPNLRIRVKFVDTTAPTLTVTAPKLNERTTNQNVLLKGTAKDNDRLEAIRFQVNGAAWAEIVGSSNWQATVNLNPGPNTLRVYAVDPSGLRSKTNVQTVTYVVTTLFDSTIVGKGSVAPVLDNQRLEVGKSYTITATAAAGFAFQGWTGSTNTAASRLTFAMREGFAVTATFRDATAPKVAITAPKLNERMTNETVTLRGTASDNVAVTRVDYRLNGGAWKTATGTNNWLATEKLARGSYTLEAVALDGVEKRSPTNKVTFVVPSYEGIYLGTFTAAPAKGVVGLLVRADQSVLLLGGDGTTNSLGATLLDDGRIVNPAGIFTDGKITATGAATGTYTTWANARGPFSATRFASGARAANAGYYDGTFTSPQGNGTLRAILAADGSLLLTANRTGTGAAGAARAAVAATRLVTLKVLNATFAGTLDTVANTITGTVRTATGNGAFVLTRRFGTSSSFVSALEAGETLTSNATGAAWRGEGSTMDAWIEGSAFTLWFSTEAGRNYTIQQSEDLVNWNDLATFTAEADAYEYKVDLAPARRFFRIVE